MRDMLPAAVAVREAVEDLAGDLFPDERSVIEGALPSRRAEFTTGRVCARAALGDIGVGPVAIPVGQRGEPVWPTGVVGSITHCGGYRAAAVARASAIEAIGIDAEPHVPLPPGVLAAVATSRELGMLDELAVADPRVWWDRLLFCTKEAAFKVWFPQLGPHLDLHEVVVTLGRDGAFGAAVARPPRGTGRPHEPRARLDGRWAVRGGLLLAAVAAAGSPHSSRRSRR